MTSEDFLTLTPEEQNAILNERDTLTKAVDELTAERNSFKTENEELTERVNALTAEVAKVKESNFTLTRKLNLDAGGNRDAEDIMHDMFYGKEKK